MRKLCECHIRFLNIISLRIFSSTINVICYQKIYNVLINYLMLHKSFKQYFILQMFKIIDFILKKKNMFSKKNEMVKENLYFPL